MNFKTKALIAAAFMAASVSANAQVASGNSGNGELVLSVWNETSGSEISYARDLGITIDNLLSGVAAGTSWNFATDANFSSFLAQTDASQLKWTITAVDSVSARRLVTTLADSGVVGAAAFTQANLRNVITPFDYYLGGVNYAQGGTVADNLSSIIVGASDAGYAANWGNNLNGQYSLDNTYSAFSAAGSSMFLYNLTGAASGGTVTPAVHNQLAYNGDFYNVKLSQGELTIAAAAPVPEADTSAMLLAGLALMGFIARRRTSV